MTVTGGSRLRAWTTTIVVLLSTLLSGILPTSMVWPGSQRLCAEVAVTVAVNPDHTPTAHLLDYRITAGHSHGPPATINGSAADGHTYYVLAGDTPVLVHNTNCAKPWIDEGGLDKVDRLHGPNSTAGNKSKFDEGVDYEELVDHAENFPARTQTATDRCERICTSPNGQIIGKDQSGLPTNIYAVVTEPNGRVVTLHPGIPN